MKTDRIIFVDKNGTERAPMAAAIFANLCPEFEGDIQAKGLVVAFKEPLNQKIEAVLASDGIDMTGYFSQKIKPEDIGENTLILAVDKRTRDGVISSVDGCDKKNTYDICGYAGEELSIIDPYGGTLTTYGICYESMKNVIKKLIEAMEEKDE